MLLDSADFLQKLPFGSNCAGGERSQLDLRKDSRQLVFGLMGQQDFPQRGRINRSSLTDLGHHPQRSGGIDLIYIDDLFIT